MDHSTSSFLFGAWASVALEHTEHRTPLSIITLLHETDTMAATDFKGTFIETAINTGVLLFGEFTLKSGR